MFHVFHNIQVLFYSEKTCLPNHLICHLDNNKDLEMKYLNDLFSILVKKMTGQNNRQTATYIFNKLVAYVRIYECMAELNKRLNL